MPGGAAGGPLAQQQQQQQPPPGGGGAAREQQPPPGEVAEDRVERARRLRRLFSPPAMLSPDGGIDQEFFRPRAVVTLAERKWGEPERAALLAGLERHGVGRWRDIGEALLPGWDDQAIRIKAAKALGCQNLSRYHGRRLTAAEVDAELEANRALGAATGCWKHGMLVDDDRGTLRQHFAAAAGADAGAGAAGGGAGER
ncbi:hypothetical protein HT031_004244 [Scenedesmus sp. PABB004]|nr:hypothetical protein HT031_004244 [Scenedesmus sp. PABB004]